MTWFLGSHVQFFFVWFMGIWLVQLYFYHYFTVMVEINVQVGSGVRWKALFETFLMFLFGIHVWVWRELNMLSHMIRTKSVVIFLVLKRLCLIKYHSRGVIFALEKVDDQLDNFNSHAWSWKNPWMSVMAGSYCWGLTVIYEDVYAEKKKKKVKVKYCFRGTAVSQTVSNSIY